MKPAEAFSSGIELAMETLWPYLVVVVLISLITSLLRAWLNKTKGARHEGRVQRRIESLGYPVLNDVYLPRARRPSEITQIDHVVALGGGLLVIETKGWGGTIFGRPDGKQWHRYVGKQKVSRQNPLHQNAMHVKAVQAAFPDLQVDGLVVFTDPNVRLKFDWPAGVISGRLLARTLSQHPLNQQHPTDDRVLLAFSDLQSMQTNLATAYAAQHKEQLGY